MESSTLNKSYLGSVTCTTCKMHHKIDENGECEFCRNKRIASENRTERKFNNQQVLLIVLSIIAFVFLVEALIRAIIKYSRIP